MKKLLIVLTLLFIVGCSFKTDITKVPESVVIITDGYGYGSGVAIRPNLILTAGHAADNNNIYVLNSSGKRYEIKEKYVADINDVGFIVIDGILPALKLGDFNKVKIGDTVYLSGAPYNVVLQSTVTKGIISGLNRNIYTWLDLVQTDAEGAPGSSGGPLLNEDFEIIGICVTGMTPGGGVTLCVTSNVIKTELAKYDLEK